MSVSQYPPVFGEYATLEMIHTGASLSRIGDGETAIMDGAGQVREPPNPALAQELREVVSRPHPGLLVGIPTLDPRGPKYDNWFKRAPRIMKFLSGHMQYVSSFVTRPDSAADDLRTEAYCARMVQLWRGKRTVLVSEYAVAIYRLLEYSIGTGELIWIACPHRETYSIIDWIEAQVLAAQPEIALLSCGPAATCLSARLARQGIWTIDIGSAGSFILKVLYNRDVPMSGKTHDGYDP